MKHAKNCAFILCNEPFIAERKDQIYCKDACKVGAYRLRKQGYESTELSDILLRAHEAELQWHGVSGEKTREAKRRREDVLRAAYDAIGAELALHHIAQDFEQPDELDELQNEPENDASPDPMEPQIVRAKLREFRAETGMGQSKVAKLAGVNQSTISLFERNLTDASDDFRRAILDVVSQDHGMDRR